MGDKTGSGEHYYLNHDYIGHYSAVIVIIQIWVDEDRQLVYFMANVKTCLETHL